jgi:hypothetical protein
MKTACHIINWVYLRPETSMTPYEIWKGRKPTVKYFLVESPCYILQDQENLRKFDTKSDESTFLGYSSNSHAYKVFNHRSNTVIESINVVINDDSSPSKNEMPKEEGVKLVKLIVIKKKAQPLLKRNFSQSPLFMWRRIIPSETLLEMSMKDFG